MLRYVDDAYLLNVIVGAVQPFHVQLITEVINLCWVSTYWNMEYFKNKTLCCF